MYKVQVIAKKKQQNKNQKTKKNNNKKTNKRQGYVFMSVGKGGVLGQLYRYM